MKVIGIDPGTGRLGWSVVEKIGGKTTLLECGCLETPRLTSLEKRLLLIHSFLQAKIKEHSPDAMSVENLFFANNAKTVIDVGAARGVVIFTGAEAGLPVFHYTPLQVKSSLTGYGKAEKSQVQFMVKNILKLKEIPKPDDAADAVAIALTHLYHAKMPL